MSLIIFLFVGFLLFTFPFIRTVVFNFPRWLRLTLKDLFFYIKNRSFNVCPSGKIICFSGLFGYGKTLSAVHFVTSLFNRYDGKVCYINGQKRIQKIMILSNVRLLNVPFVPFTSLSQITDFTKQKATLDGDKYYFVLLVLGDEFSTCLNSRSFKSNIDPIFLNTLVTCRHYSISLFYTSQRFNLVDKLLRDVTFFTVECRKRGRVECNTWFDSFDMENCSNISLLKPIRKSAFLIQDKDYNAYDTLAVVDNLVKYSDQKDFISEKEIQELRSPSADNLDNVRLSFKGKRLMKNKKR